MAAESESGWTTHPMGWASPAIADLLPLWPEPLLASRLPWLESVLFDRLGGHGWRSESFALLDASGTALRHQGWPVVLERSVFRRLGLLAESVQLNLLHPSGQQWIAQRAAHKAVDPLLWDAVVAGGLPAGESPLAALVREAREEAGLGLADLAELSAAGCLRVNRILPGGVHHLERVWVWTASCTEQVLPTPQDGEVAQFRLASRQEMVDLWRRGVFNYEAAAALLLTPPVGLLTAQ